MFNIHQSTYHICALALKQELMLEAKSKVEIPRWKAYETHPTQAMDAAGILDRHWYDVIKYR